MAIKTLVTLETTFLDAYFRLSVLRAPGNGIITCQLEVFASDEMRAAGRTPFKTEVIQLPDDENEPDKTVAAYLALKALPEYSTAQDA